MREYNNRDLKSNEAELDPCIAAEVRMKKGLLSPRLRRNLLAALIIAVLIIVLSVLLFLLLSRSTKTDTPNPTVQSASVIADYDRFEPVVETSTTLTTTLASSSERLHNPSTLGGIDFKSPTRPKLAAWPTETTSQQSQDVDELNDSNDEKLFVTIATTQHPSSYSSSEVTTESDIVGVPFSISASPYTSTPSVSSTHSQSTFENIASQPTLNPLVSPADDDDNVKDCKILLENGQTESGIYRLSLPKVGAFDAFCDMTTEGGGWTVIQRRVDGTVYFSNRTWQEYEDGFGSLSSSFWLGLKKIHALVAKQKGPALILRIELNGDFCDDGDRCSQMPDGFWWGEWEFKISGASRNYMLTISPAIGGNLTERTNMDRFFYMNNGKPFTSIDKDNDRLQGNCAQFRDFGGWWHNDCGYVALNGRYGDKSSKMRNAFFFYSRGSRPTVSYYIKPKQTKMMLRSRN